MAKKIEQFLKPGEARRIIEKHFYDELLARGIDSDFINMFIPLGGPNPVARASQGLLVYQLVWRNKNCGMLNKYLRRRCPKLGSSKKHEENNEISRGNIPIGRI